MDRTFSVNSESGQLGNGIKTEIITSKLKILCSKEPTAQVVVGRDHEWGRVPVGCGHVVLTGVGRGDATSALQRWEGISVEEPLYSAQEQGVSGLT